LEEAERPGISLVERLERSEFPLDTHFFLMLLSIRRTFSQAAVLSYAVTAVPLNGDMASRVDYMDGVNIIDNLA